MSYFLWGLVIVLIILFIISYAKKVRMLRESENKKQNEKIIILTDANFKKTIQKGVALVDFWAPWCAPCRIQNPIISALADDFDGKVKICKLNVDEHTQTAREYSIRNIPNILIFKNGEPAKQLIGAKPKSRIANALKKVLDEK